MKKVSCYFASMVENRQQYEAMLIKEKELAFTKNNFEPKINNKSRKIAMNNLANQKLDLIYTRAMNRTKSATAG